MNLQRQTAQNSPHSRRTSWVWSTKSNERNDRLYGRRTGSLRAKPGIHTDTESTRARCTATPRGLRRLHRAANLRAFPDRQGFFSPLWHSLSRHKHGKAPTQTNLGSTQPTRCRNRGTKHGHVALSEPTFASPARRSAGAGGAAEPRRPP